MTQTHGGGTIILLCEALRERISEALKNTPLETDHHYPDEPDYRTPDVINGFLPPKRSDSDPEFPFVIVRPKDGDVKNDGFNRAKVQIIIGAHSEASDGHEYLFIVYQRIYQSLMEQPTLANRYKLEYPLSWELFDEQPYPFWQLAVTTEWVYQTPVILPDDGVL